MGVIFFRQYFTHYIKLFALGFLQDIFHPCDKLVKRHHYAFLAYKGLVRKTFKTVSDEFQRGNEKIECEFVNESGRKESQIVTRLTFINNSHIVCNTVMDWLNAVSVIYATSFGKEVAYNSFKPFLLSIVYYGLDIERIMGIHCLVKYSDQASVRADLVEEKQFIDFLKRLYQSSHVNDSIKWRLDCMILSLFKKIEILEYCI